MNERDLDYFAVVAEHGHLGRAAEALGLSQPALSMSLRRLEKSVHAKLVIGTPKGVELTTVGRALQSNLQRLRLVRQDVAREITDLGQGRAGDVSISTQVGSTEDLVSMASAALLSETPKVSLRVTVTSLESMVLALQNGDLDFIVSSSPSLPAEDFVNEYLYDDEFVVIASTAHRLAGRKRVTLTDVAKERWVRPGGSGSSWDAFTRAFEKEGVSLPRFTMMSNSSVVRRRVIAYAGFLGQGGRQALRQTSRSLPIAALPVKELTIARRVMVTYRMDAYLSPAARRFIEILKQTATEFAAEG